MSPYKINQETTTEDVEVKDAVGVKPEVEHDEDTGKVSSVKVDQKVKAGDPLDVQIPPQADGSSIDGLAAQDEPSPVEVASDSKPVKTSKSDSE